MPTASSTSRRSWSGSGNRLAKTVRTRSRNDAQASSPSISRTNRPVAHTRSDDRGPIFTAHSGIELAGISGPYGRFFLAGAIATVQPGANSGDKPMEHPGEELILVLDGTFDVDVDGQHFALEEGDSLHFRTDRPHRWHNAGKSPIKAVWLALRPF